MKQYDSFIGETTVFVSKNFITSSRKTHNEHQVAGTAIKLWISENCIGARNATSPSTVHLNVQWLIGQISKRIVKVFKPNNWMKQSPRESCVI